jgi:hypothetical protein
VLHIDTDVVGAVAILERLAGDLKVKITRSALRKAAKPLVDEMKMTMPGRLARTPNIRQLTKRGAIALGFDGATNEQTGTIRLIVGPNKKVPGWYWGDRPQTLAMWLERGTDPHPILRKKYDYLWINKRRVYRDVQHPGIRARKYMARAAVKQLPGMQRRFAEELEKEIDKRIRKANA